MGEKTEVNIKFKQDIKKRRKYFTPECFAHPAKMHIGMLLWIVGKYTKPNEVILDPMAGCGTTMLATMYGRNVVLVDLEEKFCRMCQDNWTKLNQNGWAIGDCQIIQGDARNLEGLLADKIITSPPFAGQSGGLKSAESFMYGNDNVGKRMMGGIKGGTGESPDNIDHLPYGDIDKIITSPPYAIPKTTKGSLNAQEGKVYQDIRQGRKGTGWEFSGQEELGHPTPDNIANKPYGDIDSIITSPPYEESIGHAGKDEREIYKSKSLALHGGSGYGGRTGANIGDLKSDTYLEAMLQVYQQCFKVLKDGGLMIIVTKNFIRNKQVVRLDTDTIKLCEQAGFSYVERHYRKLLSQSFWRIIYYKKHPEVERIEHEDILVFKK